MKTPSEHIRLAKDHVPGKCVAAEMGTDDGTVSRIFSGVQGVKIEQMDAFFGALRLRLVPSAQVVISEEKYGAMKRLARAYIDVVFDLPPETITPELREAATLLAAEWLAKEARNGCASDDTWALAAVLSGKALQDTVGFRAKVKS